MTPSEGRPALTGIPGFRQAASLASTTYSGRCRALVAEVTARCDRMENASDPGEGADARAWLEARLAEAASTPRAVAGAIRSGSTASSRADDLLTLRTAAWLRLGRPAGRLWEGGPESRGAWSLLLSGTPTDEYALWWLASSHRLAIERLRALIGRRPPAPGRLAATAFQGDANRPVGPSFGILL
jgi:hypothetical protein